MSELLDKQVNAQKKKNFRGSCKLPQAHEKVCDENETNRQETSLCSTIQKPALCCKLNLLIYCHSMAKQQLSLIDTPNNQSPMETKIVDISQPPSRVNPSHEKTSSSA